MNCMNNENSNIIKKVVYKYTKPLLTFTKKEDIVDLRSKSAPPINVVEEKPPAKKFVLCRPDGTPITADDFSDVSDSSEDEIKEVANTEQVVVTEPSTSTEPSTPTEQVTNTEQFAITNQITPTEQVINTQGINVCPDCIRYNEIRTNILNELLQSFKVTNEGEKTVKNEMNQLNDEIKDEINRLNHAIVKEMKKEDIVDDTNVEDKPYTFVPKKFTSTQIKLNMLDIINYNQVIPFPLLLLTKEHNKVPVNADQFRVKVETIYEKVTFELNKLTKETSRTVIYNLKNLNYKSIKEAKFVGNLIVFNAVREPQYCLQYAIVVGELRKVLKSKEEEKLNKKQTAFFGTVLTSVMSILNEEIRWADGVVLDMKDFKNRSAYENAFEEQETIRYAKKKKTLGAVDFVCHLYKLNIISIAHIKNKLDEYLNIDNEEVVEVLARFIENIGEKLYSSGHSDYANKIINYLSKCKDKYVTRVKFYLMDVLDKKKNWKKSVSSGNIFANMDIEEVEEPKKDEIKIEEIKDNSSDILRLVGIIYEDLSDADGEEDEIQITDNFKRGCDEYSKESFFNIYISECITNFKKNKLLVPFFIKYFKDTGLNKEDLFKIINNHKENINELKIDAPLSPKNYTGMINKFKEENIIDDIIYKDLLIC